VSLGGYHGACVTAGGDVLTWGRGHHGQLGHGAAGRELVPRRVAGLPPAAQVACGGAHTMVVCRDGSLWAFGANAQVSRLPALPLRARVPV
jgi:alpha-tubulin suppressor-like RCC1 family protein